MNKYIGKRFLQLIPVLLGITFLSFAMMLRYTFNLSAEADAVEGAVRRFLADGFRTADIAGTGDAVSGTVETGDRIAGYIQ